ncbi:MAG: hypothetical protein LBR26_10700 [Prevotella sp.]|nr:hypothetical protein [Prevotella sp.]
MALDSFRTMNDAVSGCVGKDYSKVAFENDFQFINGLFIKRYIVLSSMCRLPVFCAA